jgi:hypothetical protein
MRGSALRAFGGASNPCAPRGLAGAVQPRAPRPRGALPLYGTAASEAFRSDTFDPRVCPFGIRTQGALLPETPAGKADNPFSPHPRMHPRSVHS